MLVYLVKSSAALQETERRRVRKRMCVLPEDALIVIFLGYSPAYFPSLHFPSPNEASSTFKGFITPKHFSQQPGVKITIPFLRYTTQIRMSLQRDIAGKYKKKHLWPKEL